MLLKNAFVRVLILINVSFNFCITFYPIVKSGTVFKVGIITWTGGSNIPKERSYIDIISTEEKRFGGAKVLDTRY